MLELEGRKKVEWKTPELTAAVAAPLLFQLCHASHLSTRGRQCHGLMGSLSLLDSNKE